MSSEKRTARGRVLLGVVVAVVILEALLRLSAIVGVMFLLFQIVHTQGQPILKTLGYAIKHYVEMSSGQLGLSHARFVAGILFTVVTSLAVITAAMFVLRGSRAGWQFLVGAYGILLGLKLLPLASLNVAAVQINDLLLHAIILSLLLCRPVREQLMQQPSVSP